MKDIRRYFQSHLDFPLKVSAQPAQVNTTPHCHEFVEMVVILQGTGKHVTLYETQNLSRGDVLIIPVGTEHQYQEVQGLSLVNILFDPEKLQFPRMDLCSLPGYDVIFYPTKHTANESVPCPCLHLNEEQTQLVEKQLDILIDEFSTRALGFRTRALGIFLYLAGILTPLFTASPIQKQNYHQHAIAKVINYLEDNFSQNITLADLTKTACMSKSTLMRAFRKQMGASPFQYLINIRLEHACQLICENQLPLTAICNQAGFSSYSYFSRCFVRRFHQTPNNFRKRLMQS